MCYKMGGGNQEENKLVKPQSQKVSNYDEVFKEKEIVSRMQEIEESHQIKKLNDDVDALIEEADAFITQNDLTLKPQKTLLKNDAQNQKLTDELKALQIELEELSNES